MAGRKFSFQNTASDELTSEPEIVLSDFTITKEERMIVSIIKTPSALGGRKSLPRRKRGKKAGEHLGGGKFGKKIFAETGTFSISSKSSIWGGGGRRKKRGKDINKRKQPKNPKLF